MTEPGSRKLATDLPGATTSGLRVPSPRLDQSGITSSSVVGVPRVSSAPTAIT
jgi:hypothetical protein